MHLASIVKDQAGAVAVTVAVLMIVMVGFSALAIDIGYLLVTRNELQNVADAAALAATRQLGSNYQNMTHEEQLSYECGSVEWSMPCSEIVKVAQDVGLENRAGQVDIVINSDDVFLGRWDFSVPLPFDPSNDPFTVQAAQPRAVRVIARRDDAANNPVTTFLAGVLGIDTMAVSAVATASLSGQATAEPGELQLPVGIDESFFNENPDGYCHDEIYFSPTNLSCAGWTSWNLISNKPNMLDLVTGVQENPEVTAGDSEFEFTGGDIANLFDDLQLRFKHDGYDVDINGDPVQTTDSGEPVTGALPVGTLGTVPMYEDDGVTPLYYTPEPDTGPHDPLVARNEHVWQTSVVVYEDSGCDNPNQTRGVVGFARVSITDVLLPPDNTIVGKVDCGYVSGEPTRGGGGEYGTIGSIPGLVQ
ncbi:MAG: hypothetical protein C0619_09490 [Desulfuromonas sp.]|nr:MAG: hypothetical protein C0619_09490 [Desulfuromonas sp.]